MIGDGSDAHLAVGTAEFLQHHGTRRASRPSEPVDQVPLVWRSKPPIYYALAGVVRSRAGAVRGDRGRRGDRARDGGDRLLSPSPVSCSVAGVGRGRVAMAVVGAGPDRALHTGMHPYFNQTWGYFALPFALVLGGLRWASERGAGSCCSRCSSSLRAFAYPLALPIPCSRGGRRRGKERRAPPADTAAGAALPRGPRAGSLIWLVPLALVPLVPDRRRAGEGGHRGRRGCSTRAPRSGRGAATSRGGSRERGSSRRRRRGRARSRIVAAHRGRASVRGLRRVPRDVQLGRSGAVAAFGPVRRDLLPPAQAGWYFESRRSRSPCRSGNRCARGWGWHGCADHGPVIRQRVLLLVGLTRATRAAQELLHDLRPAPARAMLGVRQFDKRLPADASVRLDIEPWGTCSGCAYLLGGQPICSQRPLSTTQLPSRAVSRQADYVLVDGTWRSRSTPGAAAHDARPTSSSGSSRTSTGQGRPLLAQDGPDRQEALRGRQGRRAVARTADTSSAHRAPR